MTSDFDTEQADRRAAWRYWTMWFAPTIGIALGAQTYFGFWRVFPIIILVLAIVLVYQRFVKKRSWHAIFWGREASGV